ncbi:restriction endonuclease subunit S [Lacticaseibacillus paracasei]|uniref:restriction endonuclease subunit S n=1 Tax=Lacticaseibacillus paracasei TaxID=1597 RepID=UPI003593A249
MSKDARNVPALRFKGYSDAWEKRKLGETNSYFTDGNYGESYPKESELSDKENGVPFLRGSNLRNGELIEDNANYITKEKHAELTSGHLVEDDIVLAVRGSLGALGYVKDENIDWNINSQLAVIRTDKSELSGKFLVQFLLSWRGQKELLSRNTGTALKQLPIKQLKDVPVPIVNLDEQKEIGALFSSIDNLIAATQRRINALEEIKEASSQYLFVQEWKFRGYSSPWKQVKLGEIADIIGGGTPKTDEPKFWNGKIDWYAPAEIGSNRYVSGSVRTITSVGLNKSSASILPANRTILFTSRAGIGNAAILKKDAATNQGFQSLVLKDGVDVYFMYSKIPEIKQKAIRIAAGSTFLEISGKKLSQIALLVPELNEQQRIGAFFKKLDDLIAANHSKVSRLNLLKRFLLQGLFI